MTRFTSPYLPLGRAGVRTTRRGPALSALLGAMLVLMGVTAPPAAAHTSLESSDPADGGSVDRPPASVQLVFAGRVSAADPVLTITVAGSDPVQAPAVIDGDTVTADLSAVALPGGAGATYPVSWQVGYRLVASDGDPFAGDIAFTVAGPPETVSAPPTAEPAPTPAPTAPATVTPATAPDVSAAAPGTTDSEPPAGASATTGTVVAEAGPEVSAAAPGTSDGGVQSRTTSTATAATSDGGGSGWWWAAVAALALVAGVAFVYRRKRRAGPPTV